MPEHSPASPLADLDASLLSRLGGLLQHDDSSIAVAIDHHPTQGLTLTADDGARVYIAHDPIGRLNTAPFTLWIDTELHVACTPLFQELICDDNLVLIPSPPFLTPDRLCLAGDLWRLRPQAPKPPARECYLPLLRQPVTTPDALDVRGHLALITDLQSETVPVLVDPSTCPDLALILNDQPAAPLKLYRGRSRQEPNLVCSTSGRPITVLQSANLESIRVPQRYTPAEAFLRTTRH